MHKLVVVPHLGPSDRESNRVICRGRRPLISLCSALSMEPQRALFAFYFPKPNAALCKDKIFAVPIFVLDILGPNSIKFDPSFHGEGGTVKMEPSGPERRAAARYLGIPFDLEKGPSREFRRSPGLYSCPSPNLSADRPKDPRPRRN